MQYRSLCLILQFITITYACQDVGPNQGVQGRWRSEFATEHQPGMQLVWGNGDQSLYTQEVLDRKQPLVMIRIPRNHPANDLIQDDMRLVFWDAPAEGDVTHAAIALDSWEELDQLAIHLHDHSSGFSCGRVELLSTRLTINPIASPFAEVMTPRVELGEVRELIANVKHQNIADRVADLESLGTRFHTTEPGRLAPSLIKEWIEEAGKGLTGFSVELFDHSPRLPHLLQKSVIARIAGKSDHAPAIIIGSHLDSIHGGSSDQIDAPGADDNATGVATIIEVLRVLAAHKAEFLRPIEFHAYAGEEVGLLGSLDIAQQYMDTGKLIAGMMQIDMNAYSAVNGRQTIYFPVEDTSVQMRSLSQEVLSQYLDDDFQEGNLRGGTSDHRAWARQGVHTVFPFEDPQSYNPYIHTAEDTSANINNFPLSGRFAQMALAFLSHHAGLISAMPGYSRAIGEMTPLTTTQDIYIAITEALDSDEQGFHIAASAPEGTQRLEYCFASREANPSCPGVRQVMQPIAVEENPRRFFGNDVPEQGFDAQVIRLFAFDADGNLLAYRESLLKAKLQ